jgi:hypothetical protein
VCRTAWPTRRKYEGSAINKETARSSRDIEGVESTIQRSELRQTEEVDSKTTPEDEEEPPNDSLEITLRPKTVVATEFEERHEVEQYFWSERTVCTLASALAGMQNICCLTTPALAQALHEEGGKDVTLLDIDERFASLPGFCHFDLLKPVCAASRFDVIVFDPPFFSIPAQQLKRAVLAITSGRTDVPVLMAFLVRAEAELLSVFSDFRLFKTKFALEYANVKESKWSNYALYSNIDLPGVKRLQRKK